jgi:glycosyltransferase involved in cell wall biosynthesis
MIKLSVCMIAKNEEARLTKCLTLLRPHFAELVVVDTGSSDGTAAAAEQIADKVAHFTWNDDFSAARNYSLAQASHDGVLVVDCDEFLEEIDGAGVERMMTAHPEGVGMILRHNPQEKAGGETALMVERVARLFDRRYYHYAGLVHEQAVRLDGCEPEYFALPLRFRHEGYVNHEDAAAKAEHYLRILLEDLHNNGASPYTYFQIGQSYTVLGQAEEACRYYGLGLEFDLDPRQEYVRTMVEAYGYALLKLQRYGEALAFEGIYDEFATRADFPFLMGLIYMNNALFDKAIAEFEKAATMKECATVGVNSYSAYYNIGVIYECLGDRERAGEYYRKCGDYAPAKERLGGM